MSMIGESTYKSIKEKWRKEMLSAFDIQVKRNFAGEDREFSIELRGVGDNSNLNATGDVIPLKP